MVLLCQIGVRVGRLVSFFHDRLLKSFIKNVSLTFFWGGTFNMELGSRTMSDDGNISYSVRRCKVIDELSLQTSTGPRKVTN